jgi:hypothetical protein
MSFRRMLVVSGLAAVCCAALSRSSRAQGSAVLAGQVLDSTGASIAGARLRIPQLERVIETDASGRYRFTALRAGRVVVVAEAAGYSGTRAEIDIPASGEIAHNFSLRPNAHVLAAVEVRARARRMLPAKLQEFALRQQRGLGRFLGPDQMTRYDGQPLTEALKSILTGARFDRNAQGQMTIVSARAMNVPTSLRTSTNAKSCGVQIWQDGVLLSDPNSSADIVQGTTTSGPGSRGITTVHAGADRDYDISGLLANGYMAAEYYSDLSSTPPGFRTGGGSCGVLVLWTRVPMEKPAP